MRGAPILYTFVRSDFYEPPALYAPDAALLRVVREVLPPKWDVRRDGIWVYCTPPDAFLPAQGWKIHTSATLENCERILSRAANVCVERHTPFKFKADKRLLAFTNSKGWPRGATGKFMTIYPGDDQGFRNLIDALSPALQGFHGSYILSDRRLESCPILFYRYGGIMSADVLSHTGERTQILIGPEGERIPDVRTPYFNPPPWARDPLGDQDDPEAEVGATIALKSGRYVVERALSFSSTGGVYVARDRKTDGPVLVKEARPHTGADGRGDAVTFLEKEYRILRRLAGTRVAPAPLDLFREWEHTFLVEEYLEGQPLGSFLAGGSPLLDLDRRPAAVRAWWGTVLRIWSGLVEIVTALHGRGIVFGDLSPNNVMVLDRDARDLRIIDFEGAWERGHDQPTLLHTPGFASRRHALRGSVCPEDDLYSLGAMMLCTLFPINGALELDASLKDRFLDAITADLGISRRPSKVIRALLSEDERRRPSPDRVLARVRRARRPRRGVRWSGARTQDELRAIVRSTADYILSAADPGRQDRLFPADPRVYATNPLSVAYGAAGVAYALSRIRGEVPSWVAGWILARQVTPAAYPPGLYVGSAGIAWALEQIGMLDVALRVFEAAHNHPLLEEASDVFWGAAGYGLACLFFWHRTGDSEFLARGAAVGEHILRTRSEDDRGCWWPAPDGKVHIGYAHGASGIGLFLLYLSIATKDRRFLDAGTRALDFDLAQGQAWPPGKDLMLSFPSEPGGRIVLPYWQHGSAGVGTTLLRYHAATGEGRYRDALARVAPDAGRKYAVFPGLFNGLAGLGNFLLDCYQFLGEERFLREANTVASGVVLFRVERPGGVAFPGDFQQRISTDLGTGSAGVALFLHRLAEAQQRIPNFNFLPDGLLQRGAQLQVEREAAQPPAPVEPRSARAAAGAVRLPGG
ncbi:MAG: protein kinase/lanthionine synthetase C family protein [Candidatus Riflebacteria bacterium]|nr:protein kinase/lanthionine synthetase C family protein [Candidatus Riflebacteria bacterium]